jgi:D-beta-D-heptose 7-phosphate kinase/D-beta-D-heptose 1-phosphate adenosyltransferase
MLHSYIEIILILFLYISMNTLLGTKKNIIIFGDIMMDVNIHGKINRMANESPIPILVQENLRNILGGCGNVLMNLQSLGCEKLFIFSRVGNDSYGKEITHTLSQYNEIEQHIYKDDSYTTVTNIRGFSQKKLMFRYDIENSVELLEGHIHHINHAIEAIIRNNKIDAIIFSDYNRGFLVEKNTQHIIQLANIYNVSTFVDTKSDYKKYIGCTMIKPNMKELLDVFGLRFSFSNLDNIHRSIKESVQCKETLITLSEHGMTYSTENNHIINEKANKSDVIDVTGAGDVVLSIISYCYNSISKEEILKLATHMGTLSVQHAGVYVMKPYDILKAHRILNRNKVITIEKVKYITTPIVFTNGCFDILHEGHMALLQFCNSIKPHGGEVLVAINSDESVRKLKGPTRPINDERARIAILNNIESVDWILVFKEDTPHEILEQIRPHTLVKGGDYTVEQLPGREFCENVKIFTYIDGKSTTAIVHKINTAI